MSDIQPPLRSHALINDPRPWAFTRAELTAGLRRHTGDPSLKILELEEREIPHRRPALGRIRGLKVACKGSTGDHNFTLVIKEPQGTTRTGTAGIGLREIFVYQILGDHIPVRIPQLFAAHPGGDWLVLGLLPEGRPPEQWQAADYLLATDQLVVLHDRFWDLGEDLSTYRWLGRPLDFDFNIHLQAARAGLQSLTSKEPPNKLGLDNELIKTINHIVS